MALVDGIVALAVIVGVFWIVYAKAREKNPKLDDKVKPFLFTKLYDKIPIIKKPGWRTEQIHDERRTMI